MHPHAARPMVYGGGGGGGIYGGGGGGIYVLFVVRLPQRFIAFIIDLLPQLK